MGREKREGDARRGRDTHARLLLKGGRVVDPARGVDGELDVLVADGLISRVGRGLPPEGATVLDVPRGVVLCPGLIDMHVHLREPGQEHKETIATGAAAAVAGGFTAVACMPNTDPVNDQASVTELIVQRALAAGLARVYPIGAVSRGSRGEQMAEIAELRAAGCVAVSDDGRPVATALLMRRVLEYAGMFDMPVIDHCEDPSLRGDGVAHEGFHAARLGLRGIPGEAEELMVQRDATLAGLTGSHVHIAHLSARGSLRAVREAKARGIRITCEVAPHHFTLTDESLEGYETNVKMNPPLRDAADRDAMVAGIADGSVDAIATDHAPHHHDEKNVEFDHAPFGIVGLETAVSLTFDRLVHTGRVSLARAIELLSVNPARILRVPGGSLAEGSPADVTLLAPDLEVTVDPARFRSRSRNTPFSGWTLRGGVAATIVGGRVVYVNEAVPGLAERVGT
jgi:dihydroorotase